MPSTPTWGIPYPALSDPPNGPSQIQSLATQVDSLFTTFNTTDTNTTNTINNGTVKPLRVKILGQVGTYLTTSGSTELGLTKLSLTGINLTSTQGMKFVVSLRLSGGTVGDTFSVQVRQTTALTGTPRADIRHIVPSANQHTLDVEFPWLPGVTITNESFHLSLVRVAGTGVLGVEADSRSSFGIYSIGDNTIVSVIP